MRKLLTFFLALTYASSLFAYDCKIDGIYYNLDETNNTATVTNRTGNDKAQGYSGSIVIPSTITYKSQTYSVTTIGDYAFNCCSGLTSVTIPNSVTTIGEWAIAGCKGLTSLTISNSVTAIRVGAFSGCSLTSITIPNSVTTIGDWAFAECFSLTSITIGNSVTTIGYNAFYYCKGLTSITIPNSVTTIGNNAFFCCKGLTSIIIPNSVTTIGEWAFASCYDLTSVTILNPFAKVGGKAFDYCTITDIYCGASIDLSNVGGTIKNVHRISEEELISFLPFNQYAKGFIEPRINEWQKKGEFEKTADWQARVTDASRKQKIDSLVCLAKKNYLAHYQKNNSFTFTLGTYDADNEVYLVQSSSGQDLFVAVPIADASYVKQYWASHTASPQYDIQGTEVVMTSAGFTFPNKKTYTYKINEKLTYATTDLDYNFEPIEIPQMQTVTIGGSGAAQAPQAPQGITEVVITTPFAVNEMSSVLVTYKNMFGKYEMPDKDVPFPFSLIRVSLKGDPKLVRLAAQSLSLDMGQFYATEQMIPLEDKILFLVSSSVKNIFLKDGNGQRQLLFSGRLVPNKIYDGTVEVK